jgi:hypothetical protein
MIIQHRNAVHYQKYSSKLSEDDFGRSFIFASQGWESFLKYRLFSEKNGELSCDSTDIGNRSVVSLIFSFWMLNALSAVKRVLSSSLISKATNRRADASCSILTVSLS